MDLENVLYMNNVLTGERYGVCTQCAQVVSEDAETHSCGDPDEVGIFSLLLSDYPVGDFLARAIRPGQEP